MTDLTKTDILLLGATGFTGRLVARYLVRHPQRQQFTLAFGGRSEQKLAKVLASLGLTNDEVGLVHVDISNEDSVQRAVRSARVVMNVIGPYWLHGTPIVQACARNGVHYVDLSGEGHWIFQTIRLCDFLATKTGSIIVHACGYDSIPSDISAYLSAKTLHSRNLLPGTSTTCHTLSGGISGGTVASALNNFELVPRHILEASSRLYSLSPIIGCTPSGPMRIPKLVYQAEIPKLSKEGRYHGAFFPMSPSNRAIVERTFGLFEQYASNADDEMSAPCIRYGSDFFYDEFLGRRSTTAAFFATIVFAICFRLLAFKPVRYFVQKTFPQPGEGTSESTMQNGFFKAVNITTSAPTSSSAASAVYVKSVVQGQGDPGYSLTAIMISESALSILLPPLGVARSDSEDNIANLTPLAQKGGVLTPMSAFGDQLIQRLEDTGKFTFSSEVW